MSNGVKIQSATYQFIPGVSWWKNAQVLAALGGIACGVVAFAHAFHIPMPFTSSELVEGFAALGSIGSCVYFLYRRWRAGRDPLNPTPALTK